MVVPPSPSPVTSNRRPRMLLSCPETARVRPARCRDRSASGITRSARSRPATSVLGIPNMFSAAGFQYSTRPAASMMTTASMADARIAEVKAVSCRTAASGGVSTGSSA